MGDDNLFHFEVMLSHQGQNVLDVIPRINDNPIARSLIADYRTIALERTDGQDFVDHEYILVVGLWWLVFGQKKGLQFRGGQGAKTTDRRLLLCWYRWLLSRGCGLRLRVVRLDT